MGKEERVWYGMNLLLLLFSLLRIQFIEKEGWE